MEIVTLPFTPICNGILHCRVGVPSASSSEVIITQNDIKGAGTSQNGLNYSFELPIIKNKQVTVFRISNANPVYYFCKTNNF